MGYYLIGSSKNFKIKRENFEEAYELVKETRPDLVYEAENLDELLREHGFTARKNDDGDIFELEFEYSRSYHEAQLLDIIAPCVEDESLFEIIGEGNDRWAYYFLGGKLHYVSAVTSYPRIEQIKAEMAFMTSPGN